MDVTYYVFAHVYVYSAIKGQFNAFYITIIRVQTCGAQVSLLYQFLTPPSLQVHPAERGEAASSGPRAGGGSQTVRQAQGGGGVGLGGGWGLDT